MERHCLLIAAVLASTVLVFAHGASIVPKPPKDCSNIACTLQHCPEGQSSVLLPGECCPHCAPCEAITCPPVDCKNNEIAMVTPDSCCAHCVPFPQIPGCESVRCPTLLCRPAYIPVLRPGRCCPSCEPNGDVATIRIDRK